MADTQGVLAGAVGVFGGSFNPVHNGHLRMAIEMRESLGLARVDFVPAHVPPHKSGSGLLPFALRLDLVREAVEGVDGLGVSAVEAEVAGPSYSFDTMARLRAVVPDTNFVFIMGSTDLLTLPDWHRGLELPLTTDIAVAARTGLDLVEVDRFLDRHWAWREDGSGVRRIDGGRCIVFIAVPRLDISASLVREKFFCGRELSGLVPEAVRRRIMACPALFARYWKT